MSIDSCYENILARLTTQGKILEISKKLLSLKHNDERVLLIYDSIKSLQAFPNVIKVNKCQSLSTHYRNLGNKYFQKSENHKAWQYYNLSLLYAPKESEHYCLALSNRSAVFFALKNYNESLNDIEKVLSMVHPEKIKEKLLKRRALCKEYLSVLKINDEDKLNINEIAALYDPKDTKYVSASSKLEVVFNTDMGRHVVAKEDIKVGDVLVQEDPYLVLVSKSQYLICCNYCLSRSLNLIPCEHCCFSLYCSTQCKDRAWKDYHSVECPLMSTLVHMDFTKLELLALRITIRARVDHADWKSLFKTIEEAESRVNSELHGCVKIDNQWVYDSKYYASIHTLASNVEKRSVSDIFQKGVTAAVFLKFLIDNTAFLKTEDEKEKEVIKKTVAGILLLHIMTSPTNMHGISTNIQTEDGNFVTEVSLASAPYAYHSLLNHSCTPNVVRFSKLGTAQMTLFALRPIKKGMQLFDNYGAHHAIQNRNERQQALKFQYKFTCLCEACVNDWPTYLNLGSANRLSVEIMKLKAKLLDPDAINKLQKGNKSTAVEIFKPLCRLVEALDPFAPCMELANCEEALKQCLVIFEGLLPLGHNQMIEWKLTPQVK